VQYCGAQASPTVASLPRMRLSYPRGSLSIVGRGIQQQTQNGPSRGRGKTVEDDT